MAKRPMPPKRSEDSVRPPAASKAEKPIKLLVANCQMLNLRERPDRKSKILEVLPVGTVVLVDEVLEDWFHISAFGNESQISKKSKPGYIVAQFTREA